MPFLNHLAGRSIDHDQTLNLSQPVRKTGIQGHLSVSHPAKQTISQTDRQTHSQSIGWTVSGPASQ